MRSDKPYIEAFKIRNSDLPLATGKMNGDWNFFKSRVISLIPLDKRTTIVSVEMEGYYPFITSQWSEVICP